jgi:hypothetical protein
MLILFQHGVPNFGSLKVGNVPFKRRLIIPPPEYPTTNPTNSHLLYNIIKKVALSENGLS